MPAEQSPEKKSRSQNPRHLLFRFGGDSPRIFLFGCAEQSPAVTALDPNPVGRLSDRSIARALRTLAFRRRDSGGRALERESARGQKTLEHWLRVSP